MKVDLKHIITLALFVTVYMSANAESFSDHFCDSTLRLDYILSGTSDNVAVSVKSKQKSKGWHGRRTNLDRCHYTGNIDLTMTSMDGDTIYRHSLSSLFCEWLDLKWTTPEGHECTVLMPYPKDSVRVTIRVLDKHHSPSATISHVIDPKDILIRENRSAPLPHKYIRRGSYPGHKISVAFMGEGYLPEDMDTFYDDAAKAVDAILSHEPFGEMRERFDFIAVETPSAERKVSVPAKNEWHDTYFKSHFSTFYSDRYLTSDEVFRMNDALNGIPYEHIIILVNSPEYGGGGIYNDYTLTSAHHPDFLPVVVHEFGHSFGGLADEYFYEGDVMDDTYPTDAEPWEPNITTLVDFGSKWQDMLADDTPVPTPAGQSQMYPVGVYEGGGYSVRGVYRPADYCRMRVNNIDGFCPVCQRAIRDLILYYTE